MRVCQNPLGCSNIAFPKLVLEIMPVGRLVEWLNGWWNGWLNELVSE